jgi:hypothetical protein
MTGRGTDMTVDELLTRAGPRSRTVPAEALEAQAHGALLVDIRGQAGGPS